MKKNSTVDFINQSIKIHGVNNYNDPIFRVVFSDDQTEKRWGDFSDYHGKIILVRKVREIREVQKYPWIKGKWIIERWAAGRLAHHKDLQLENDKNGVYICVYVFQDKNNNYLPPLLKVTEIVINNLLNPISRSEALIRDIKIEHIEEKQEIDIIENELIIQHDESASKDKKAQRETASSGYTKTKKI